MTHIALLRGINVGGKNMIPMKDLALLFTKAGCTDAQTYIQSGNVVFNAAAALAKKIPGIIDAKYHVPTVMRTADEMKEAIKNNPFLKAGIDEKFLHVFFLADVPLPQNVAALDPNRSPGDRFVVRGREIYIHVPNGMGHTKLANTWFDSKLKTVSTARNWRTCLTLYEMTQG